MKAIAIRTLPNVIELFITMDDDEAREMLGGLRVMASPVTLPTKEARHIREVMYPAIEKALATSTESDTPRKA